jgi:WD40 repeat protein
LALAVWPSPSAEIWDWRRNQRVARLENGHLQQINSITFHPRDERFVLTTSGDHTAGIWNWKTRRLLAKLVGHADVVSAAIFQPDGRFVLTGANDGEIRLYDCPELCPLPELVSIAQKRVDASRAAKKR